MLASATVTGRSNVSGTAHTFGLSEATVAGRACNTKERASTSALRIALPANTTAFSTRVLSTSTPELVYNSELLVGIVPSSVYRISAFGVALDSLTVTS